MTPRGPSRGPSAAPPAHHRPGGGFRNPWPNASPAGLGALLRWAAERRRRPPTPGPDAAAFPRVAPSFDHPRAAPDAVTATWVGHSTFLLQIGGWNVLVDPVWGRRASPVPWAGPARYTAPGVDFDALPPADLVVLSHDHYDHLDVPTVRRLAARFPAARWAAPLGVGGLLRTLGARDVAECDWWDRAALGPLDLTCVPAQHFSGRGIAGRDRTLWAGWVLRARGGARDAAVYFAGDTGLHPDFADVGRRAGPAALVLLPIGAYAPRWFMRPVHCDPDDALAAYAAWCDGAQRADPAAAAPTLGGMHFGAFRLTDEPTDEPPRRARAAWARAGHDARRLWIPRHGETWRRAPNGGA